MKKNEADNEMNVNNTIDSGAVRVGAVASGGSPLSEVSSSVATKKSLDHVKSSIKGKSVSASEKRPCKEHSFLTDVADVRTMEQGLIQLLEDFHSGKLQAFGGDCTFEKMDQIREQQERLARLHFELDLQQDLLRVDSEETRASANENLSKLIAQLQTLSCSIQCLHNLDREGQDKRRSDISSDK